MNTIDFGNVVLSEIEKVVNTLPAGVAKAYIGPSKRHPGMIASTFRIEPASPNAAPIAGAVTEGEVTISVGHSRQELWTKRATASDAAKCAQLVSSICRAVFAGNFTELIRVDRDGRMVSSRLTLCIDGGDFRMWHSRLLRDALRFTRKREIHYARYVTDK
jgi:hypothetical protein